MKCSEVPIAVSLISTLVGSAGTLWLARGAADASGAALSAGGVALALALLTAPPRAGELSQLERARQDQARSRRAFVGTLASLSNAARAPVRARREFHGKTTIAGSAYTKPARTLFGHSMQPN